MRQGLLGAQLRALLSAAPALDRLQSAAESCHWQIDNFKFLPGRIRRPTITSVVYSMFWAGLNTPLRTSEHATPRRSKVCHSATASRSAAVPGAVRAHDIENPRPSDQMPPLLSGAQVTAHVAFYARPPPAPAPSTVMTRASPRRPRSPSHPACDPQQEQPPGWCQPTARKRMRVL